MMDDREAFDALILAARNGDVVSVRKMMGSDASPAHIAVLDDAPHQIAPPVNCTAGGVTPLHIAALLGRKECVDALVTAGVEVRTRTLLDQCSAAMCAAYSTQEGTADIMCTLLRAGADLSERSEDGLTLVAAACSAADTVKVRALLEAGAPVISTITEGNRTLLTTSVHVEGHVIIMDTTSVLDKISSECSTIAVWRDEHGEVQTRHTSPGYKSSGIGLNPFMFFLCAIQ